MFLKSVIESAFIKVLDRTRNGDEQVYDLVTKYVFSLRL